MGIAARARSTIISALLPVAVVASTTALAAPSDRDWGAAKPEYVKIDPSEPVRVVLMPFVAVGPGTNTADAELAAGLRRIALHDLGRFGRFVLPGDDETAAFFGGLRDRLDVPSPRWIDEARRVLKAGLVVYGFVRRLDPADPVLDVLIFAADTGALLDRVGLTLTPGDTGLQAAALVNHVGRVVRTGVPSVAALEPVDPAVVRAVGRLFPVGCSSGAACVARADDVEFVADAAPLLWAALTSESGFAEALYGRSAGNERDRVRIAAAVGLWDGVVRTKDPALVCLKLRGLRALRDDQSTSELLRETEAAARKDACLAVEQGYAALARPAEAVRWFDTALAAPGAGLGDVRRALAALPRLSVFRGAKADAAMADALWKSGERVRSSDIAAAAYLKSQDDVSRLDRIDPTALGEDRAAALANRLEDVLKRDPTPRAAWVFAAAADRGLEPAVFMDRMIGLIGKPYAPADLDLRLTRALIRTGSREPVEKALRAAGRVPLWGPGAELLLAAAHDANVDPGRTKAWLDALGDPVAAAAAKLVDDPGGAALDADRRFVAGMWATGFGVVRRDRFRDALLQPHPLGVDSIGRGGDPWGAADMVRRLPRVVPGENGPVPIHRVVVIAAAPVELAALDGFLSARTVVNTTAFTDAAREALRNRYDVQVDADGAAARRLLAEPAKAAAIVGEAIAAGGADAAVIIDQNVPADITDGLVLSEQQLTLLPKAGDRVLVVAYTASVPARFVFGRNALYTWLMVLVVLAAGWLLFMQARWVVQFRDPKRYADWLERRGNLLKAAQVLTESGRPDEANRLAAQHYLQVGQYAVAIEHYLAANMPEQALVVYQRISNPDNTLTRVAGDVYLALSRYPEALRCYRQVDAPLLEARVYEKMGDPRKAAVIRARHLRKTKDRSAALVELIKAGVYDEAGNFLFEDGEYRKAAVMFAYASDVKGVERCAGRLGTALVMNRLRETNIRDEFGLDVDAPTLEVAHGPAGT